MDDDPPDRFRRVNERVDIRVGVKRRRRWRREDELRIVPGSLTPDAVVNALARRYDISTSLPYTWRKQAVRRTAPNGGGHACTASVATTQRG